MTPKNGKQPQEEKSGTKEKSPLKKLQKDVEEAKSAKTKGGKKEESKKSSKTVDDVPGHSYKT